MAKHDGLGTSAENGSAIVPSLAGKKAAAVEATSGQVVVEVADVPTREAPMLQPLSSSQRVVVDFDTVSAFVPNLFAGKQDVAKERQVLFEVTGRVEPGEVLALMGPSGSGKTSLLTILGRRSTARTSGSITFNGRPADKAIKRKIGYVTQDDQLFADLTVYETLFYTAMLRLPRDWSMERKLARLETVMDSLGLDKCRDTIIGGHMRRGVSGGERKRVAVGEAMLINPSILFLDEPTSGLDSTTALHLMQTLRSLAGGGRTIITSIHQPSSRLYQKMDKLMLLSEGHTMFYGSANLAAVWFITQGQPAPFGVNISDHMLDLSCGDPPGVDDPEQGKAVREELVAAYENRECGRGLGGITAADFAEHVNLRQRSMSAITDPRRASLAQAPSAAATAALSAALQAASSGNLGHGDSGRISGTFGRTSGGGGGGQKIRHPAGSGLVNGDSGVPNGSQPLTFKVLGAHGVAATANGLNGHAHGVVDNGSSNGIKAGAGADVSQPPAAVAAVGDTTGSLPVSHTQQQQQLTGATLTAAGITSNTNLEGVDPEVAHSVEQLQEVEEAEAKWGASFVDQVRYLSARCIKTRRFTSLAYQKVVQILAVAILAGLFWFQLGSPDSVQGVEDIGGLLFFAALFIAFNNMFQSLFTFPVEFAMLLKERQGGMFRLSAYYIARTTAEMPMDLLLPSVYCWILYFMTGLRLSAGAFFANYFSTMLIVLVAQSIGLLIGATVMNLQTAQTIATIFTLGLMLVGGFYVSTEPVWINWMRYLSFIYWGWNLLLKIEFRHRRFPCNASTPPLTPNADGTCDVAQANLYPQVNLDEPVTREVCILIAMLVALRIAVYYALQYKTTFKKQKEAKPAAKVA